MKWGVGKGAIFQGVDLVQEGPVINVATPPNIKRTFDEKLKTLYCVFHLWETFTGLI